MAANELITELSAVDALDLVRDQLRRELPLTDRPIDVADQLDSLPGADSVRLMRVVAGLERQLHVEFDDDRIRGAGTVGDIADLVVTTLADETVAP